MLRATPVYLDHAATTPADPRVVEAMLPYFGEIYGNPLSTHSFGHKAESVLNSSRAALAKILRCTPDEIIFTSGGTESNNLALRGAMMTAKQQAKRGHIITAKAEHHAVSVTAAQLGEIMDCRVTWLSVSQDGMITPESLRDALADTSPDESVLVSIMLANNEVGTTQPIAALAKITHEYGALFHTDAVQAAGQLSLDVAALGVDMLSLSAHKFYGPKGVGLLYVRSGVTLVPSQSGGGQETDRRAGTHNVPLIVGMAKALELAYADLVESAAHYRQLRDRLIDGILNAVPESHLTGADRVDRLPNHASFVFDGVESNLLLMHLDMAGIAASAGSACNTGNPEPSAVLLSMGYEPSLALSSLRLTVGKQTTDADIDRVLDVLPRAIEKVRAVRMAQTV